MTVGNLTLAWDLKLPRGGQQSIKFPLKLANGIDQFPITGKTFEYVARTDPNGSGSPLISVTTALTTQGQLTVDTAKSVVTLSLLAAATAGLTTGVYYHALWMDPDQTTAFNWFAGKLIVEPASQP